MGRDFRRTIRDRGIAWAVAACGLLLAGGCLPRNGSVDLLHARLRQNEEQLAELQSSLQSSSTQLKQARREIDLLRTELAEAGNPRVTPEHAAAMVQVSRIEVLPWLTGGIDKDDDPGDDALAVYFTPRDDQGEVVKLPGNIKITLTDPALETDQQTVGSWTFSPEECRDAWTRGFMGGGYQFTLPWENSPVNARLVVHVEYATPDGRSFDDTQLVKVHPSAEAVAKRPRSQRTAPKDLTAEDLTADRESSAVRPASRLETLRRPVYRNRDESSEPDELLEDEADERPQTPHSANWTDDTIPRLR